MKQYIYNLELFILKIAKNMYDSIQPSNHFNRARIYRPQHRRRKYQRNPYWKKPLGYNRSPFQDPRMFFLVPNIYQSRNEQNSLDLTTRLIDLESRISELRDDIKREKLLKTNCENTNVSSNATDISTI